MAGGSGGLAGGREMELASWLRTPGDRRGKGQGQRIRNLDVNLSELLRLVPGRKAGLLVSGDQLNQESKGEMTGPGKHLKTFS